MRPDPVKTALRTRMRAVRAALPDRERRAALISQRLLGLPEVGAAAAVLLYDAFGSEVPTAAIRRALDAEGRAVLYPYLQEGAIEVSVVPPGVPLVPSAYGPGEPEPGASVDPAVVDAAVLPGLAFDREGRRLGLGGGHYDRLLLRLRPEALRVGLAFEEQVVDELPEGPGDERVDAVVTDVRVLRVHPGRGL